MSISFTVTHGGKMVATINKQFSTPNAPSVWVLNTTRGKRHQFTTAAAAQSSAKRFWPGAAIKKIFSTPYRKQQYGRSFSNVA